MKTRDRLLALAYHSSAPVGKVSVVPTKACRTPEDLALAYTPGVAEPCLLIRDNPQDAYAYTGKGNSIAVVTDGSAVLGLGNLGPLAAKPVMEGKAVLFKRFADIDAVDIEISRLADIDIVDVIEAISPSFGGINLEDIKSPECFDIETRLKDRLAIPVFHDDQHGTAVVIAAGLLSALDIAEKNLCEIRIVVNGAGAAATATVRFLVHIGVEKSQIIVCDTKGVIHASRNFLDAPHKAELASRTDARTLEEALYGADVFIGVSAAGAVTTKMLQSMATSPVVFALANPTPEISYRDAKEIRPDAIVATGRSNSPNQVNNVLAFPYLFRAALDCRASQINFAMMEAAAYAIAGLAQEGSSSQFGPNSIIPSPFDERLFTSLPVKIALAAECSGVAQKKVDIGTYRAELTARGNSLRERFNA